MMSVKVEGDGSEGILWKWKLHGSYMKMEVIWKQIFDGSESE